MSNSNSLKYLLPTEISKLRERMENAQQPSKQLLNQQHRVLPHSGKYSRHVHAQGWGDTGMGKDATGINPTYLMVFHLKCWYSLWLNYGPGGGG